MSARGTRATEEDTGAAPKASVAKPAAAEPAAKAAENTSLVKVNPEDIFPDGCERFRQDCCCCHCVDMRRTMKRIAFLQTPEGQERLELKMHLRNFFMDIDAMAQVHEQIDEQLHGCQDRMLTKSNGFPLCITKVSPVDENCMLIEWCVDDSEYVGHFEIYVDYMQRKRVYSLTQTSTALLDTDMNRSHRVLMRAVPKPGLGYDAHPADRLVKDLMCGGLKKALQGDYFCKCDNKELNKKKLLKMQNRCQTLIDFWKDSEYCYEPKCNCKHDCDCYLFD